VCAAVVFSSFSSHLLLAQRSARHASPLTPEQITLYARILHMADTRTLDESLVRSGLTSSSAPIRAAASRAVAQLAFVARDRVIAILRERTNDSDTAVAANALFGLGLAHDTASLSTFAAAVHRGGSPGDAAAWALGELGPAAAGTIAALLGERLSTSMTIAVLTAETRLPTIDVAAVKPYLKSKNAFIVVPAAMAIARHHRPEGVRALISLVSHRSSLVRTEVAAGLTAAATGDSLRDAALDALSRLLADDYSQVRIAAVRSAATYGPVARIPLTRILDDQDEIVRIALAQSSTPVFGHDTVQWQSVYDSDTTFAFQRSVVKSALAAGVPLPILNKWRTRHDWRHRAAFVAAWETAADTVQAKVNALLGAQDPDGRVRATAYGALAALNAAGNDSILTRALEVAVTDTDLAAREGVPTYARIPTAADSAALQRPMSWYEGVVRDIVIPSLVGPPRGATLVTDRGTIRFAFYGDQAPLTVYNFMMLAARGYYNRLRFHRVVPAFVAQDGDPRGDGNGGPGYAIRDELTRLTYNRGMVGMALAGPNTGGSQYFMTLSDQPRLDGHYPLFGRVVTGLAVMDALVEGDLIRSVTVQ
jgi:cyclophilin family peptidyl-prolyl cis-trans isomerase